MKKERSKFSSKLGGKERRSGSGGYTRRVRGNIRKKKTFREKD